MLKIAKTLLVLGSGLLVFDGFLMAKGKSNPIKGWPLPCPITLSMLGTGLLLLVIGSKKADCSCSCDCVDCDDEYDCLNF